MEPELGKKNLIGGCMPIIVKLNVTKIGASIDLSYIYTYLWLSSKLKSAIFA